MGAMSCSVFFDTELFVEEQLPMWAPLLHAWIGDDFCRYHDPLTGSFAYNPIQTVTIAIQLNPTFAKSASDAGRFRYEFALSYPPQLLSEASLLARLCSALETLWETRMPTCVPGKESQLPYEGGRTGPISWPEYIDGAQGH